MKIFVQFVSNTKRRSSEKTGPFDFVQLEGDRLMGSQTEGGDFHLATFSKGAWVAPDGQEWTDVLMTHADVEADVIDKGLPYHVVVNRNHWDGLQHELAGLRKVPAAERWEFIQVVQRDSVFAELGEKGWEMCAVDAENYFWFKKRIA